MADRAEAPRARCLCLDIETARQDRTALRELGVFRPDLDARLRISGKAPDLVRRLDALTEDAAFVLGHNVVAFDQPALARLHPGLALHRLPLVDHPEGRQWYRPIHLLGADDVSPEEEALTRSPAQRAALTAQIEGSLLRMHAFWLPLRQAVAEREQARRLSPKVGRNEPCPCGSGKKFRKCCGASSERH